MPFILMAVYRLPAMFIGIYIDRHITLKLSREPFLRLIYLVILISGISLFVNWQND